MKKLVIIALCLSFGCNQKEEELPANILSKEDMTALLIDIHLAEGTIKVKKFKKDSLKQYTQDYYNILFSKHNTTKEGFEVSQRYYLQRYKVMESIYQDVLDSLTQLREHILKKASVKSD